MDETKAVSAVREWEPDFVTMMKSLRTYVTKLQSSTPIDALGKPTALVNPTAIMATGLTTSVERLVDNPPEGALLPISNLEGMPTIFGVPIWEKLEGEKLEYYELFKRYRMMADEKATRSVYKLFLETAIPVANLEILRQVYNWQVRAQAFDEYMTKERNALLEIRRKEIEGRHAKVAQKIFDECTTYLLDNTQMLTPKTALQWAQLAMNLERISAGMTPDKPGTIGEKTSPTINIQNNVGVDTKQEGGTGVTGNSEEDKNRLKQLLNIMDGIGLFQQEKKVIDVESEGVDDLG
jgi:hypothetical protein